MVKGVLKKKNANVWLLYICLYISHFTFWERSQAWLGFSQRHMKNVKGLAPFPNLSLTNSNLETASHLTVLKGYRAVMLVLNTDHFSFQVLLVVQFGALWVLWRSLFRRGKGLPQRTIVTRTALSAQMQVRDRGTCLYTFTQNPAELWTISMSHNCIPTS